MSTKENSEELLGILKMLNQDLINTEISIQNKATIIKNNADVLFVGRNIAYSVDIGFKGMLFASNFFNIDLNKIKRLSSGSFVLSDELHKRLPQLQDSLLLINLLGMYKETNSKALLVIHSAEVPFIRRVLVKAFSLKVISSSKNPKTNHILTNYVGVLDNNTLIKGRVDINSIKETLILLDKEYTLYLKSLKERTRG